MLYKKMKFAEGNAGVDEIFGMVKSMAPDSKFELKYNKFYIGLLQNEQINNFVIFIERMP